MCANAGVVEKLPKANSPYRAAGRLRNILEANQHRALNCAGALCWDPETGKYSSHKGLGSVKMVLTDSILGTLRGSVGIGHLRWSTLGDTNTHNIHPICGMFRGRLFGVTHNGEARTDELERWFPDYEKDITTDTKLFTALISHSQKPALVEAIQEACFFVKGTYSLLIQCEGDIYAVRDITGNRPLFYGENGEEYLISSESPAIEILGRAEPQEVEPGTIVKISQEPFGHEVIRICEFPQEMPAQYQGCLFEFFYYMRPDSIFFGRRIMDIRERMGEMLAYGLPPVDVIMPVPDSGIPAAVGCSRASGIPLRNGIVRSRFAGRYFIEPKEDRETILRLKYNFIPEECREKSICVLDDSLIEGTTARYITGRLRDVGAREVHWRISSPPTVYMCPYGTPTNRTFRDLIASHFPLGQRVEGVRKHIGATSLFYLTEEQTACAVCETPSIFPGYENLAINDLCASCFTGIYKIPGNTPEEAVH